MIKAYQFTTGIFTVLLLKCLQFISNLFQLNWGPDTRRRNTFIRPKVDTVFKGENSLRIFGPTVWDEMLPKRLKQGMFYFE